MITKIILNPEPESIDAFRILKILELDYAWQPLDASREISVQHTVSDIGPGFLFQVGSHEGAIALCQQNHLLQVEWMHLPDQNDCPQNRVERFSAYDHRSAADLLRDQLDQACHMLAARDHAMEAYNIPDLVHVALENLVQKEPLPNPVWCPLVYAIDAVNDGRGLNLIVRSQNYGALDAGEITWFPAAGEINVTFDTALEWISIGGHETQSFASGDYTAPARAIYGHLHAFVRAVHREKLAHWLGKRPSARRNQRYQLAY